MKLFKNWKIKLALITIATGILAVSNIATGNKATEPETGNEGVQITVLYDNYTLTEGCRTDWGFSCLVTGTEKCILFDTGTHGNILLDNIERLQAPTQDVELVVISHHHLDHIGGLLTFLGTNNDVSVYLPPSVSSSDISNIQATGAGTQIVNAQMQLCERVHLTGPLGSNIIEQAMVLETPKGLVVITGCAHPGVVNITRTAKQMLDKDVYFVLGGFHLGGQSDSQIMNVIQQLQSLGVKKVGPSHCTGDRAIELFRQEYGDDFVPMGIGKVTIPIQYDLNKDGTVDINDLVIIIESWGHPDPSADIAPSPFGDGTVDINDLELFMSYYKPEETQDPNLPAPRARNAK
jgi:7,8-dihydropterin-6-yl-methyl-4-(beta-D-ribofuranosyl)aminobenzene 5'-phosphate synthase